MTQEDDRGKGASLLAAAVWPEGQSSLVLRILAEAGAVSADALVAAPKTAARVIVEHEEAADLAVARHDAAVARGTAEGGSPDFRRRVDRLAERQRAFLANWSGENRLVVSRADLRAAPEAVLARVLTFLGAAPSPALLEVASAAVLASAAPSVPGCERHREAVLRSPTPPVTLIHLHVPKTAGTSLNTLLNRNYPKDRILPLHRAILPSLKSMPVEERRKLQVIHGHLAHGVAELLPQSSVYLCLLRRPAARLFSFYQFILRRPQHPLHSAVAGAGMDFGRFLSFVAADPKLRYEFDNGQMRRIAGPSAMASGSDLAVLQAALRHLLAPDMIFGLTEHYDRFVAALEARGFIRKSARIEQNVSPRGADHGEALARLTEEERQIHDDFCLWDEQLYSVAETFLFGPSRPEH